MSQLNITKQGDEAFIDNEPMHSYEYTIASRDFTPPKTMRYDWRTILVTVVCWLCLLLGVSLLYVVFKTIYCWDQFNTTCQTLTQLEPIMFTAPIWIILGGTVLWGSMRVLVYVRREQAITNRTNLVKNRYGDNQPADLFHSFTTEQLIWFITQQQQSAAHVEMTVAQHKRYRGINSLSLHEHAPSTTTPETPLLVDDESDVIVPVPPTLWLQWLDETPHIMPAAQTGKGKSTLAKAVLAQRLQSGEQVFIIDPHSADWFGLIGRGGANNWQDISIAIRQVYAEYVRRLETRRLHLETTGKELGANHFQRLTIVIDEVNAIKTALDKGGKHVLNVWKLLTETLGSGARKVRISMVLLSHSTAMEDLGLSGSMRQNFTRIALDSRTAHYLIQQEETNPQRRKALYALLEGVEYPAVTVIDGQAHVLDRTQLDQHTPQIDTSAIKAQLWQPDPLPPLENVLNGQHGGNGTDGRTDTAVLAQLIELRCQGFTRDQARDDFGVVFSNEDWVLAGTSLGEAIS